MIDRRTIFDSFVMFSIYVILSCVCILQFTVRSGFLIVTPMQGLNFPAAEHLELKAMEKAQEGRDIPWFCSHPF